MLGSGFRVYHSQIPKVVLHSLMYTFSAFARKKKCDDDVEFAILEPPKALCFSCTIPLMLFPHIPTAFQWSPQKLPL